MQLQTIEDIRQLGTILGIWAHPDDETYSMAGLMAAAVQNGQQVVCITATRGEKGSQDEARWPAATLGAVRQTELEKALSILGVQNHYWLDYPDGECADIPNSEAVDAIARYITTYQPDTVITFPPDGTTGHLDHVAVSRWVRLALEQAHSAATLYYTIETQEQYDTFLKPIDEQFDVYFNIDQPTLMPEAECDLVLELEGELLDDKLQALIAMPSQTEAMIRSAGIDHMRRMVAHEAFVQAGRDISWGVPRGV